MCIGFNSHHFSSCIWDFEWFYLKIHMKFVNKIVAGVKLSKKQHEMRSCSSEWQCHYRWKLLISRQFCILFEKISQVEENLDNNFLGNYPNEVRSWSCDLIDLTRAQWSAREVCAKMCAQMSTFQPDKIHYHYMDESIWRKFINIKFFKRPKKHDTVKKAQNLRKKGGYRREEE